MSTTFDTKASSPEMLKFGQREVVVAEARDRSGKRRMRYGEDEYDDDDGREGGENAADGLRLRRHSKAMLASIQRMCMCDWKSIHSSKRKKRWFQIFKSHEQ